MAAAPRLILHCGLHKTGTSTLQFALARARPALAASGVLYPTNRALGIDLDVDDHNPLAARLLAAGGDSAAVAPLLAPLAGLMATPGLTSLILSAEEFSHVFLNPGARAAVLDALAPFRPTLLYYLRRQDALKEAVFAEVVKGLYRGPIDGENHYEYNLMARFTPLLTRLAPDQLKVRPYARRHWLEGDLLADFGRAVGLAVPLAPPPRPLNQGLPRPLTYLLAAAPAGRVKGRIKFFHQLYPALFHDRHRALTPPAARAAMLAALAPGNRAFARAHGIADIDDFLDLTTPFEPDWRPIAPAFAALADKRFAPL